MDVKCSVYIAASVDGFIARPDGDVSWLHEPEDDTPENEDFGYDEFIAGIDALVMGRNSFEKVLSFPSWPYEEVPVIVLSSREVDVPDRLRGKVKREGGKPEGIVSRLAAEGKRHLYIDGGITIQRFLRAGLIDELTITRIPVLLGDGIPLFGALGVEVSLLHIETTAFSNGFVQTMYRVHSDA